MTTFPLLALFVALVLVTIQMAAAGAPVARGIDYGGYGYNGYSGYGGYNPYGYGGYNTGY